MKEKKKPLLVVFFKPSDRFAGDLIAGEVSLDLAFCLASKSSS